ncbi:MAG TPA: LysR family transcriptional regulator, partial [Rhizomicrobium sp.]
MDRLDAMAVLVAAADSGSLSAAARKLGMPLATVSRKVSELEAHLETRLLVRSSRRLAPTEAGAAYLAAARRILEQVDEAERAAAGEYSTPRGELAVAAPIVFGRLHVLPVVTGFLADYPLIDVRLILSDRNAPLLDEHIDIALRIGALPDSSLVAVGLGSLRRVVCGSPAYLAARGTPRIPDDLAAHDGIVFDAVGANWTFGGGRSVRVHARLAVNTA